MGRGENAASLPSLNTMGPPGSARTAEGGGGIVIGAAESEDGIDHLEDDDLDHLEDDDLDALADDLTELVDRRPRKTDRKQGPQNQWEVVVQNVARDVFEEKLAASVKVELDGAEKWAHGVWKPPVGLSKLGLSRRVHLCPFRGAANSGCCASMRETVNADGLCTLERKAGERHADHKIDNKTRGLPKFLKVACGSPSKRGLSSTALMKRLREEQGAISQLQRKQILAERKINKAKAANAIVPRGVAGGFGGLAHVVDNLTPAVLELQGRISPHQGA